jgi:hypothetical protein
MRAVLRAFVCVASSLGVCALATELAAQDPTPPPPLPTPPTAVPVAAADFLFRWPLPCTVVVEKAGDKRGKKATLRYRLEVAADGAEAVRVRHRDFTFLTVNGVDATTPAMQRQLATAQVLAHAVPDLLVSPQGDYLRIDGIDGVLENVATLAGESRGASRAQIEQTIAAMRTPPAQEMMQQAGSGDWLAWVGAWLEFAVPAGEQRESEEELDVFGEPVVAKVTRRHHGPDPAHPGHVRLSITSTFRGEAGTAALAAIMARMASAAGGKPMPPDELLGVEMTTAVEVVTDPHTLQPRAAKRRKDFAITTKSAGRVPQRETAEFTFTFAPPPAGK